MKTKFALFVLSILIGSYSTSLLAQTTGTITGIVVNNETGEPLSRANILLEEIMARTVAGPDGSFEFSNIARRNYTISVTHVGFRLKKEKIDFNESFSSIEIRLIPRIEELQEVVVTGARARNRETPVAFSNFTKEDIEERYRAQDVPFFLAELPGVNVYSMNGNGIGYSEITIRGFDQRRIAVLINGIPQNDPESHSVYWIDLPDILESVEDIQVQRGVGSSLYGGYGIGGVINLVTDNYSVERDFSAKASFGSYNTRKFTMSLKSGLIDNSWTTSARFSRITSNGYRDQSWVDLWSYFISVSRFDVSMTTRVNLYGGPERTHFAFFGATKEELEINRKSNPSVFPGDTDNFNQPHYELINEWDINENISLSNTFFYIKGDGFFQFRDFKPFDYLEDVVQKDLLDIKQYGWLPRLEIGHQQGSFIVGGELRYNNARHWKEILARFDGGTALIDGQYEVPYDYRAKKLMVTLYVNELYKLSPKLTAMAGLQFMYHNYKVGEDPVRNVNFDVDYSFITPRLGLNYNIDDRFNIFGNFSMARREPALFDLWDPSGVFNFPTATPESFRRIDLDRNIWEDPIAEPEELTDWELGIGYQKAHFQANFNAYIMDFRNEIVNSGYLGASGFPLRNNSAATMHRGLEFSFGYKPDDIIQLSSNLSLSENFFQESLLFDFSGNSFNVNDNTIPNFPGIMTNNRITVRHEGARASFALRYVGKQYLDNTESEDRIVSAYTLGTLSLGYDITTIPELGMLQLSLDIYNLFDEEYESFGHINFFGEPAWIPGANRNFMFTIKTVF